jgi:UDP-glucuronate decarboxylase
LAFARDQQLYQRNSAEVDLEFGPLPDDDPMRQYPDTSRAKELLGWEARTSLKDGLVATVEWFADQQG